MVFFSQNVYQLFSLLYSYPYADVESPKPPAKKQKKIPSPQKIKLRRKIKTLKQKFRRRAKTIKTLIDILRAALKLAFDHTLTVLTVICDGTSTNLESMRKLGCDIEPKVENLNGLFEFKFMPYAKACPQCFGRPQRI